jgi:hypothetical protein
MTPQQILGLHLDEMKLQKQIKEQNVMKIESEISILREEIDRFEKTKAAMEKFLSA